jgi:hypothetical protein
VTLCKSDFEVGVDEATIATTDAGSPDAWSLVDQVGGLTIKYDSLHAAHGAMSAHFHSTGSGQSGSVNWDSAKLGTITADSFGRFYLWIAAAPTVSTAAMRLLDSGGNSCFTLNVETSRVLTVKSGSTVEATGTVALPTGQWVRVEWKCHHNVTSGNVQIWVYNTPDAAVGAFDETFTSVNFNTRANETTVKFGPTTATTQNPRDWWYDDVAAGGTVQLGPATTPPVNTVAPALSGDPSTGHVLATTNGTWTNDGSPAFTYQWQRDNSGGGTFSNIAGQTASTHLLVSADVGCQVRCVVTCTDSGGAVAANSNALTVIVGYVGRPGPSGLEECSFSAAGTYTGVTHYTGGPDGGGFEISSSEMEGDYTSTQVPPVIPAGAAPDVEYVFLDMFSGPWIRHY